MSLRTLIRHMGIAICLAMGVSVIAAVYLPAYGLNKPSPHLGDGFKLASEKKWVTPTAVNQGLIAELISQFSELEIYETVYDLQNFQSRVYGYPGNTAAATYLYNRFDAIAGLNVEYQGGYLKNVIATLPGLDASSSEIYIAGAHYDSASSDPSDAPGALDDATGVAIVLEFARILSQYRFNHTLKFACWNREEDGLVGSRSFVTYASSSGLNIPLYVNLDSPAYDPYDRFILDIVYNTQSTWAANMLTEHNSLYGVDFTLTYNVHLSCGSDHKSFWQYGYTAITTHEETHGPQHTPQDTLDKVSTLYAKKNGQLCLSVLARVAEATDDEVHDVEVDSVTPSKTVASTESPISIGITVRNSGSFLETITVTTTTGMQSLDERQITLASHTATTFVFPWNIASLPLGEYTIVALANPVLNETDLADNTCMSEPVTITIAGDVTGDYAVNIFDVVAVANAYHSQPLDPHWNPNADLNNDQQVDIFDVVALISHYGEPASL